MRHYCTALLGIGVIGLGLAAGCSSEDDGDDGDDPTIIGVGTGGATTPVPTSGTGVGGTTQTTGAGTAATGAAYPPASGGAPVTPGAGGSTTVAQGGSGNTGTGLTGTGASVGECSVIKGLGADADECGAQAVEAQFYPVNILLVMDKSGSMANVPPGYPASKWDALKTALQAALTGVQDRVSFGLQVFPTTATDEPIAYDCGARCCEMPAHAAMNVPIQPGPAGVPAILDALQSSGPAGATPTARALQRAYDYFSVTPIRDERYVLLATDGGPNCNPVLSCELEQCTVNIDGAEGCSLDSEFSCCYNKPDGCLDADSTIAQIEALQSIGVRTIVVGIPGSELYAANLNDFAVAGQAENPNPPPEYYEVSAAGGVEELTATFVEITISLGRSCEILIPPDRQIDDLNKVNVALNCQVLPKDAADGSGWVYVFDANGIVTSIQILGPACDMIQDEGVERIDTVFDCNTILR